MELTLVCNTRKLNYSSKAHIEGSGIGILYSNLLCSGILRGYRIMQERINVKQISKRDDDIELLASWYNSRITQKYVWTRE
jgi:hypothetical protein